MKTLMDGILRPVTKFRGGVEVNHTKKAEDVPLLRMPCPKQVVIPMQQSVGAPCDPLVKVGDHVDVGQKIGDTDKFISAPVHASISGTVTAVKEIHLAHGLSCIGVTIESDGLQTQSPEVKPPVVNSKEDFFKAVRECGLVGLGGAGFPTHAKLQLATKQPVDTLIINAAECEPYISVDNRECIEHPEEIMEGINALCKYIDFKQVIIGVEDNKPKALKTLSEVAASDDQSGDKIKLMAFKTRYPQGAEKMMILVTTGRRVPPGKLPADVGCVVMNVETVAVLGRYLRTGRPLVSRSVTVDGSAFSVAHNVRVPVGVSIDEIVAFCGGFKREPKKVLFGGPMMGIALSYTDAPICKQNNAILAFSTSPTIVKPETDCIHCGRCVHACPMSLLPTKIVKYTSLKDPKILSDLGTMVCMECGSCAFNCPAGRPLVQYMRLAKKIIREESQKK